MASSPKLYQRFEAWHHTKLGHLVFAVVEAGLAYLFASLAIPSAHTWQWFLAAIFALGVVRNGGLLIYKIFHDIITKAKGTRQN